MSRPIPNLNSLICPITHDIFIEPVIGSDCHTYERHAIMDWLKRKERSPITYESMSIHSLRSNLAMKHLIEELCQFYEINIPPPPIPPRQPSKLKQNIFREKERSSTSRLEVSSIDNDQLNKATDEKKEEEEEDIITTIF